MLGQFRALLKSGHHGVVAWRGSEPIGYGWVAQRMGPDVTACPLRLPEYAAYLWELYVIPSERSNGIGSALASARIRTARERGFREGWRMISPSNAASLRTLAKSGTDTRVIGEMRFIKLLDRMYARFTPAKPRPEAQLSDSMPAQSGVGGLKVVVLTSAVMGVELASALSRLEEVGSLTVVTTRVMRGRRSFWEKLRGIYHYDGPFGVAHAALRGIGRRLGWGYGLAEAVAFQCPGVRHVHCDDLHAPESLAVLRGLKPDLGVVFAAYRLKPEVFTIPRLGCLNLHLGHAPEFRGSSPAFYEMLKGVPTVGVTVHRISEGLDAGPIIAQESFPLDLTPDGDPNSYLRRYQAEILIPNGVRLMADVVRRFAGGEVESRPQPGGGAPARPRATYRLKRELRRRVARRRRRKAGLLFYMRG
jgi:folate-dependent phosphoribosylglycinamide formyltransferase PurN/GNAT superfamily N-acetyltransferase